METTPLYTENYLTALERVESDKWRLSLENNLLCAHAMETAWRDVGDDRSLREATARLCEQFSPDRCAWVLANTVQMRYWERKVGADLKLYSSFFRIPCEKLDCGDSFIVGLPAETLNRAVRDFRAYVREKDWLLAESVQYASLNESYRGCLVLLRPQVLTDEYRNSRYQFFVATAGFGCEPHKRGEKIFGFFLADGERACVSRSQVYGIAVESALPPDLAEKWREIRPTLGGDGREMSAETLTMSAW